MVNNVEKLRIGRWGNSSAVRIPKSVLNAVNFSEDDYINIWPDITNKQIIIAKVKKTVEELFDKDYTGNYNCETFKWDIDEFEKM